MRRESAHVYEWQVLPFGTTSSPCCAIFAVQKQVRDHSKGYDVVKSKITVGNNFYDDNCLTSCLKTSEAKSLDDRTRVLLTTGSFQVRQWATNYQSVVAHLPPDARSQSLELWLSQTDGGMDLLSLSNMTTGQCGLNLQ